jgi:hypothetical protein
VSELARTNRAARYENVTGTITLSLRSGAERTFGYISPKERTSEVATAISDHPLPTRPAEPGGDEEHRLLSRIALGGAALVLVAGSYAVAPLALQVVALTVAGVLGGFALRPSRKGRERGTRR